MRKASAGTVAMILGVALYFTLFWGYDALRVLTSPTYGLEDVWRSQFVFGVGSYFHLAPMGLIRLAAFFGTRKARGRYSLRHPSGRSPARARRRRRQFGSSRRRTYSGGSDQHRVGGSCAHDA